MHIGQNVKEVLDCDLAAEMSARALYQEAATHCHAVKDYVTRDLFEKLMHDEEEHIDFLETQLDLVAKLGVELYSQHHIGKIDDDHLTDPGIGALPGCGRAAAPRHFRAVASRQGRSGARPLDGAWLLPYVRRRDTPPHRGATIWKDRP